MQYREFHGLADLGIVSLDLHATVGTRVDNGNLLGLVSSYTTTDGGTHDMAGVWFAKQAVAPSEESLKVSLHDVLAASAPD
ncbi:MAG: hypothetical protein EOO40_09550, partial [Deltaproteobacteria bacterium]